MKRRTFDRLLTTGGAVMVAVFLVAGSLLFVGYNFANGQVHDQLAQQQIFFPDAGSKALADPEIGPYLNQYAGQQLTTGAQAEAYSDHFIAVHLQKVANGQTYSQVSTKLQADPTNATLKGQAATLFQGETLRGLLLNAYAFGTIATIALYAAIGAYAAAAAMLILVGLGIWHSRKVDETVEVFAGKPAVTAAA